MPEIIKNNIGRFREVLAFSFDYKNIFLSLTVLCECSAKGRGQVWPGLSCPALMPLSPNDLVTSPLSPGRKCLSHADPSTPVQGCGAEHAACSVPCYQNSCWPATVSTGQNGNLDVSEVDLEKWDWSNEGVLSVILWKMTNSFPNLPYLPGPYICCSSYSSFSL